MTKTHCRWLLVDVSGLLYRAHFSLGQLTDPTGVPSGALFGFIRSFLKTEKHISPDKSIAIFDGPSNKQSRLALYPEYKAHRKPTPIELIEQSKAAQHFCQLFGLPMLAISGVEADDVIATVARHALQDPHAEIIIVSCDKDLNQLLAPQISICNPVKETTLTEATFITEWGITPKQFIDYLAIVGDASDNVPGIEGMGPKTALSLIQTYGSLENIYEHLHDFTGKKREKLESNKHLAFLSRSLIVLDDHVKLPDHFSYEKGSLQRQQAEQFFQEKGFRSLFSLLPKEVKSEDTRTFMPHIIASLSSLTSFLEKIPFQGELALDIETTSLDLHKAELVGIGLAYSEKEEDVAYIPIKDLDQKKALSLIEHIIATKELTIIGHNLKFDLGVLKQHGFSLPCKIYDTLLASWIMRAHERTHGLDVLVFRYFHKEMTPIETLIGKGKAQKTMDQVSLEQIAPYCGADVHYTFLLYKLLSKELANTPLEKVLKEIEFPLLPILLEMEARGVYVNKKYLEETGVYLCQKIQELESAIFSLVDKPFNLNSPKQLSEILYDQLKLPAKKTKSDKQRSTDADTLEELFGLHPIIEKLLEYRQLEKLRSTYVQALLDKICPKTGRVHCTFMQAGTTTGRLACQDPNLQNIPIKTEMGKRIRAAFCPELTGWKIISADYSQIELRILAHISKDPCLIDAFKHKQDIHAQTAAQIFHVPVETVTEDMRRRAKAVNFGIIYGQQAFGLSKELHIPVAEAQHFIDRYFATYPCVKDAIARLKEHAKEKGYAETLLGRRRLVPEITSSQFSLRTAQERLAINTPFQGLAADIIKLAMLSIDQAFKKQNIQTKMVLQIHDELLFEAPEEEIDLVIPLIKECMQHAIELDVPLTVEIGIGKNWKEC